MLIQTTDRQRIVDVGGSDIWHSLYSTVAVRLRKFTKTIPHALKFLQLGRCPSSTAFATARELNLVRDALSQIRPEQAVYDKDDPDRVAPWSGNISGIVTSCGNMFLTADGKDLLYELVSILTYAHYANVDVEPGEV